MQWPEETNAVAEGDTFWTLITRDCGIILNWVHLKKSRIIFFVFVTYWQSMARFRKNDFLKWAQKIKSVFCFIPHTHEGCDWADARISDMVKEFQSTHTRRMWPLSSCMMKILSMFQSTHPRRVWQNAITIRRCNYGFNPHTHEGCDPLSLRVSFLTLSFNPHTHEGCDYICIQTQPSCNKFQSTHPRRVWLAEISLFPSYQGFQSTHPRRVWRTEPGSNKAA